MCVWDKNWRAKSLCPFSFCMGSPSELKYEIPVLSNDCKSQFPAAFLTTGSKAVKQSEANAHSSNERLSNSDTSSSSEPGEKQS